MVGGTHQGQGISSRNRVRLVDDVEDDLVVVGEFSSDVRPPGLEVGGGLDDASITASC